MYEKVKLVCTAYAAAKAVVLKRKPEEAYYRECARNATTLYEKYIFERELKNLADEIGRAAETVALYEVAVSRVRGRPRLVVEQIYEKGFKWRDVTDENNIRISEGSIAADLKKAFAIMEEEIEAAEKGFADYAAGCGGEAREPDCTDATREDAQEDAAAVGR